MQVLHLLKVLGQKENTHNERNLFAILVGGSCVKKRELYCTRKSVGTFGLGFQITYIHVNRVLYERLHLAAKAF